ncbi:MAG: NfeD family protein [Planctomycetota bacterium]|nr:NfeD family protein [Planctomycetota bacterium]
MSLTIVALLFAFGVGLVFSEVFIPGGIVGVIGTLLIITAIGAAFVQHGLVEGSVFLTLACLAGFAFFHFAMNKLSLKAEQSREDGASAIGVGFQSLLGKSGQVQTVLRPIGTARIDNNPVDVVTRGEWISPGTVIEVIEVEGNRVVVRARES